MKPLISLLIAAAFSYLTAQAAPVHIYLAAGQSNATASWSNSIESRLNELSPSPRHLVVNSIHSGNWMPLWWNEVPKGNYVDDSNKLQKAIDAVKAEGDTPIFKDLFWIQGEGDSKSVAHIKSYKERFIAA
ncbi:hypothetical protein SH580_01065 [Coraliomargarita algicola]|uniref:Sialate O-acetylesterase domain-containing protein n=1 Tax=Coraliomargarita algicola TaxID=3092156 RepID=A0ABZ0RMA6_9BACT|nr:hypothetical protein [Coraliomargarita sp. J2-16]WPJ96291.1 hypothetical protein SH580_01065 [Coraliomargarita sp. J2-16]